MTWLDFRGLPIHIMNALCKFHSALFLFAHLTPKSGVLDSLQIHHPVQMNKLVPRQYLSSRFQIVDYGGVQLSNVFLGIILPTGNTILDIVLA